ncbi:CLUMA_CG012255, isoform A [Clunio marinus]|uniref:CLUMA_CG012255, isoform A n=1 Tax=Clunio marinus TaxID=568069 RepID=A0A1J1IFA8_9DIPT|nr:CLUMA_CG012255, isoform A [Clunio marinus]
MVFNPCSTQCETLPFYPFPNDPKHVHLDICFLSCHGEHDINNESKAQEKNLVTLNRQSLSPTCRRNITLLCIIWQMCVLIHIVSESETWATADGKADLGREVRSGALWHIKTSKNVCGIKNKRYCARICLTRLADIL